MKALLALIKKLYGSKALQNAIGTRTNVITLPDKNTKRFITNELNIESASDAAAEKAFKDAEKLIADIPKMNDQELLTFTGNLQRLDNKLNPPSAEIVDIGTKKPVTGIEKLAAERGFPRGMEPDSPLGQLLQSSRKLDDEITKAKSTEGNIPFTMVTPKGDVKGKASADDLFDMITKNPARSGGPLDPNVGIVRTAARQILRKKLDAGEIDIPDAAERDAIAKGYQGGVDPIEVFRKRFGEDPLQDLDEIADELNRASDFNKIDEILKRNKLFDVEPQKNYGYQEGSMTDEELRQLLKSEEPKVIPADSPEGKEITEALMGKPKATVTALPTADNIIASINKMEPMDGMKEVNKVLKKEGKYKNISDDDAKRIVDETEDTIFERNIPDDRDDFAGGGVAYLMGL